MGDPQFTCCFMPVTLTQILFVNFFRINAVNNKQPSMTKLLFFVKLTEFYMEPYIRISLSAGIHDVLLHVWVQSSVIHQLFAAPLWWPAKVFINHMDFQSKIMQWAAIYSPGSLPVRNQTCVSWVWLRGTIPLKPSPWYCICSMLLLYCNIILNHNIKYSTMLVKKYY